jgi:hypothetical protein
LKRPVLFLLADKDMQEACIGCFVERKDWASSFGCRPITVERSDLIVPPGQKDPGLFARAPELARPYLRSHAHLLVVLDADWAGSPGAEGVEKQLGENLARNGWSNERAAVVAIDPELEAWAWSDRRALTRALEVELRATARGRVADIVDEQRREAVRRPKDQLETVRKALGIPASSAQFRRFAIAARIEHCADPGFIRLRDALRRWFPP